VGHSAHSVGYGVWPVTGGKLQCKGGIRQCAYKLTNMKCNNHSEHIQRWAVASAFYCRASRHFSAHD
jgi:hypothetical protein